MALAGKLRVGCPAHGNVGPRNSWRPEDLLHDEVVLDYDASLSTMLDMLQGNAPRD